MGTLGSYSMWEAEDAVGGYTSNPFRTSEGWTEFRRRMDLLHGMATDGQMRGIMVEIQEWERTALAGLEQEAEYHQVLHDNEVYEKLLEEGKST